MSCLFHNKQNECFIFVQSNILRKYLILLQILLIKTC